MEAMRKERWIEISISAKKLSTTHLQKLFHLPIAVEAFRRYLHSAPGSNISACEESVASPNSQDFVNVRRCARKWRWSRGSSWAVGGKPIAWAPQDCLGTTSMASLWIISGQTWCVPCTEGHVSSHVRHVRHWCPSTSVTHSRKGHTDRQSDTRTGDDVRILPGQHH